MGTFMYVVNLLFRLNKSPDQMLADIVSPFTKVVSKLEDHAVVMVQKGDKKIDQAVQLNKQAEDHHLSASKALSMVSRLRTIL